MPHVIRVPSDVTLEALRSALAGVRAARVAVIFPLGRPSHLGTSETIRELHSYALILEKEVLVIGGDQHLRALAVASGFAAATSLEEWEETQPKLRAVPIRGAKTRPLLWELTDLTLVRDDWFAVSSPGALDYPYNDEPPAYVQDLLVAAITELDDSSAHNTTGSRGDSPDDGLAEDEREALALRDAHEHYEEHITTAIRESGGVSRPLQFEIRRLTTHAASTASALADDGGDTDGSPAL